MLSDEGKPEAADNKARSRAPRILTGTALVLVVLVALHALIGFLLLPWLAQRHLPQMIEQKLGRNVTVGEFKANPFLLTFAAHRVAVEGDDAAPMLSIEWLRLDLSPWSLVRGVWTLDEIVVQGLAAHAVLRADGTLNFLEAARRWRRGGDSADEMPAVQVSLLELREGRLTFTDQRGPAASIVVYPITLKAQDLSTFEKDRSGSYTLTAALPEGASLDLGGTLSLQPAMAASGSIELHGLQASTLLPLLRQDLHLSELQARLDLAGRYAFRRDESLRLEGLSVGASDVRVTPRGEKQPPLLMARQITAQGGAVDFGRRTVRVDELLLADGRVHVAVARDGSMNWTRIMPGEPGTPARPDAAAAWQLSVPNLRGQQMDISYLDSNEARPLSVETAGFSAELQLALSAGGTHTELVASGVQARWDGATLNMPQLQLPQVELGPAALSQGRFDLQQREITARSLRVEGARVAIVGQAAPDASREDTGAGTPWRVRLERLEVAGLGGRYAAQAGRPPALEIAKIDGHLALAMDLGGAQTQVVASGVEARVQRATIPGSGEMASAFRVSSGQVAGGRFDLAARRIGAARLEVNGTATLVRNARGEIELPPLLAPGREAAAGQGEADATWRYRFDLLRAPSVAIELIDRTVRPALQLGGQLQGHATDVASDKPAAFEARLRLGQGGSLAAKGTVAPRAAQVSARVEASGVALRPFQPLVERIAALEVRSGAASANASVHYGRAGGDLRVEGKLGLSGVRVDEAGSGDRFLSWQQLDLHGAVLDLGARRLTVDEVDVLQPGAKIVISQQRKLNLAQVLKRDDDAPKASGRGQVPAFDFVVRRVRLREGEVDFADLSLVLPFSTTVKELAGTVVDISSDPARRAAVEAAGSVQPYGSARVEGSLVPAAPSEFTDLQLEFDNILVPPLSPYTATFAGRKVQSGRLWLDLHYRVEDGELRADNDVRLRDFRLGERVEAPNALDLPLDMVIALLTDADGDIRLSVPVTGEVGNARFSVASAVRQALGNVLQRIVSAPFRALAGLLGTNESLASIDFSPGSATLRPQEIEKLDALARAMRERPRVRLVVQGPYDPQLDASMLQSEQAQRELAQALGRTVGPLEDPGPIAYDDPATRRALRRMLRARAGDEAVQELEARFTGEARGLYEAMFDRIAAAQPLSQADVQVLAAERAREIAAYLRRNGIEGSRVQTGRLASVRAQPGGEVSSQLELAAAPLSGN